MLKTYSRIFYKRHHWSRRAAKKDLLVLTIWSLNITSNGRLLWHETSWALPKDEPLSCRKGSEIGKIKSPECYDLGLLDKLWFLKILPNCFITVWNKPSASVVIIIMKMKFLWYWAKCSAVMGLTFWFEINIQTFLSQWVKVTTVNEWFQVSILYRYLLFHFNMINIVKRFPSVCN